jgi:transposase
LHDSQRDTPRVQHLRQRFRKYIQVPLRQLAAQLKFIDESGSNLGLTRAFGRAAPGTRVTEGTPGYSGKHYTFVAALGLRAVTAPWLLEGAMTQDAFETYVGAVLAPTLQQGDVVLIDNLNVHQSEGTERLIGARGARLQFLPPYSSDLNPIELCWAKVKTMLRKLKARTVEALVNALCVAFESITPNDLHNWFAHCGYLVP